MGTRTRAAPAEPLARRGRSPQGSGIFCIPGFCVFNVIDLVLG